MNVYRHQLKGTRFVVMLLFFIVLVVLNILILSGAEAIPVKIFVSAFTLLWLAFTVDSLATRTVVDEKGIGQYSWFFKRHIPWREICAIKLGHRWVLGTYLPQHVIIEYRMEKERSETRTLSLHQDIQGWRNLLAEILAAAPPGTIEHDVRVKFS